MRFLSWDWYFRICFGLNILSRNGFEIFLKRQFTIATRIFCHFYPNFYLNPIYRRTRFFHFLNSASMYSFNFFLLLWSPLLQNVSQISKKDNECCMQMISTSLVAIKRIWLLLLRIFEFLLHSIISTYFRFSLYLVQNPLEENIKILEKL